MKTIKSVLIGAFVALLGSSAWAADVSFKGQTITYTGTGATHVQDGDNSVTITWKSETGTLVLPANATADILVVGGGGGGGGGYYSSGGTSYYGNGGNGGAVVEEKDLSMQTGSLSITVGAGGSGSSETGASSSGGTGNASSVSGAGMSQTMTLMAELVGSAVSQTAARRPARALRAPAVRAW